MKKEIGLYVHIPFCVRKCAYCDFASFAGREQDEETYVNTVLWEAEKRSQIDASIATLYCGGGTPSLLPPALMEWLLSGIEAQGDRSNPQKWHVVDSKTEAGMLLTAYNSMDAARQARLLGYAEALSRLKEQKGNE